MNLLRSALALVFVSVAPGFGIAATAESTVPGATEEVAAPDAAQTAAMAGDVDDDDLPLVKPSDPPQFTFPQRRESDGYTIVLYAPQFRRWPDFERIEAWSAIKVKSPDGKTVHYGTVAFSGDTEIDMEEKTVTITKVEVDDAVFVGDVPKAEVDAVENMATRQKIVVPTELILAHLTDDVLDKPPPPGFNTTPPNIVVAETPTLLLSINGDPVMNDVTGTGLKLIVNASWPLFFDPATKTYYLCQDDHWLTAKKVTGPWKPTTSLPSGFGNLPKDQGFDAVARALPARASDEPQSAILTAHEPTELIVIGGTPALEVIPETDGLEYVTNTTSPLFKSGKQWFYLVSGRWFETNNLAKGPWTFQKDLPAGFAKIPADHATAAVRASVPDTVEARFAALESSLPTKTTVKVGAKAPVEVSYAGDPKFEPISGTEVSRAANSSNDVILFNGQYYLCYAGVWYLGSSPTGPYFVAASVPQEIYAIPPSSPSYPVTQVTVAQASTTEVIYTYPPSYSTSVWVVYGVPYYGTGWYYPPYWYGGYYYPYYGSYGYGSWYNPVTGGFGSRSVWYGPYGGYSYTQGYNPRTGRYGVSEAAWDGSGWAQSGAKYNTRNGVYTESNRAYDYSSDYYHAERAKVGPNGGWTTMDRQVSFAEGSSQVRRQTSSGASSVMNRSVDNGQMTSSGTITGADGRTATVEGEHTRAGGTTTVTGSEGGSGTIDRQNTAAGANRQGSFTNAAGETINTDTTRSGTSSKTDFETSGGASGTSIKNDGNRTTVGQSGSGDVYAGHNGNVYKKTDDGWQQYSRDNGWKNVESESIGASRYQNDPRVQSGTGAAQRGYGDLGSRTGSGFDRGTNDMGQLNRDYNARQYGNRTYQQRSYGGSRGGGMRGGGMRGGGGRRR